MKLIIGLGNPEEKYKNNRHNVGHMVIDKLKVQSPKLKVKELLVAKTNTFMNDSGEFVKKLVEQYHINPSDLWVIHDDLDIPLGSYKIQFGKGPKEHKGLVSIDEALVTSDYWHVRGGVENRDPNNRVPGEEYVLQDFSPEEKLVLDKVIRKLLIDLINLISK